MSLQHVLRFDEDFIESRKDHDQVEFMKCVGCRLTFPESDLIGGFCQACSDINEKEEATEKTERLDKGPGPTKARGNQLGAGHDRLAI